MIKILQGLLGMESGDRPAKNLKPAGTFKRPSGSGDFRAAEIEPGLLCCAAVKQVMGRSYLLREAPRLPLQGCSAPIDCSCKFRKHADRRNGDRRLFGTGETDRWFVASESRRRATRRSAVSGV
jgi:hypothetical protein